MIDNSEKAVLKVIEKALNLNEGSLSLDGSMQDIEQWDSLGHIGILVALDKYFDGKVGNIKEMANADSVRSIINILKNNSLM